MVFQIEFSHVSFETIIIRKALPKDIGMENKVSEPDKVMQNRSAFGVIAKLEDKEFEDKKPSLT